MSKPSERPLWVRALLMAHEAGLKFQPDADTTMKVVDGNGLDELSFCPLGAIGQVTGNFQIKHSTLMPKAKGELVTNNYELAEGISNRGGYRRRRAANGLAEFFEEVSPVIHPVTGEASCYPEIVIIRLSDSYDWNFIQVAAWLDVMSDPTRRRVVHEKGSNNSFAPVFEMTLSLREWKNEGYIVKESDYHVIAATPDPYLKYPYTKTAAETESGLEHPTNPVRNPPHDPANQLMNWTGRTQYQVG